MTLRSFPPGVVFDKVTGKGVPVMTAKVFELLSDGSLGDPVDIFDPEDTVNPRKLTTNQQGYYAAFKADADRLQLTFGGVTLFTSAEELYASLKADAVAARDAAEAAAQAAAGVTKVALDTDGVPYYDPAGTTLLTLDTDGIPYFL